MTATQYEHPASGNGRRAPGAATAAGSAGSAADVPPPITPGGEPTDRIFAEPVRRPADFAFDATTARVFDDMVSRSVPFYGEIQRMTTELAASFAAPGSTLYDIGCSTGTTLAALEPWVDPSVRFVGYDNSPQMVERARRKLEGVPTARTREIHEVDVHQPFAIADASVTVMLFTLQFVRPLQREHVVRTIADGTRPDGVLILAEKVIERDTLFNRLFIEHYYAMKRRHGYTEMEIAQKREALENVLVPYHMEENAELLRRCGYTKVQEFFRWYNFAGVIAVK